MATKVKLRGGVHPPDSKAATAGKPIEPGPVPARLLLAMAQHLGHPATPQVEKGDHVERGQEVGCAEGMVSAPVHSPVTGTVKDIVDVLLASGIRSKALVIEPEAEQDLAKWVPIPEKESMKDVARAAGLVGMGGATFPSAVKLAPPGHLKIDTVILNGCECEPYLTCDHRIMLEQPEEVVEGGRLIAREVGASRVVIGLESNKPDAAEALRGFAGDDVEIMMLPTRYPQGAEKQLIHSVLGREVPRGQLPAAAGALVHNVGTAVALYEAVKERKPLMERVVTMTGSIARPGNYKVFLGTVISDLVEFAGGLVEPVERVVAGGPMTGMALGTLEVPVVKGTSGVVALPLGVAARAVEGDQCCIRCAKCAEACPMFLQPYALGTYADRKDWDRAQGLGALDCIECGSCSFVCPTRRPLVQLIKGAKATLMQRGSK